MSNQFLHIYSVGDEAALEGVAARLARFVRAGDAVILSGDLGAGKTRFTQGVARALGVTADVVSPTFNILLAYEGGRVPLYHLDLYRLENEKQLEDIDFYSLVGADSAGVALVEWGERFPGALPDDALFVNITTAEDGTRDLAARATGPRSEELLAQWQSAEPVDADQEELRSAGACARAMNEERASARDTDVAHGCAPDSEGRDFSTPSASPTPVEMTWGDGPSYVLAFDTANEMIAIGLGVLDAGTRTVTLRAGCEVAAHRASNTQLLPRIDELVAQAGIAREAIRCVTVGRGPGSFTGVRIAMATAKGIASALGCALCGVSSLDAVAWNAWRNGVRGRVLVVADAMRKEVYPAYFDVTDEGVARIGADRVVKAEAFAEEAKAAESAADALTVTGDALQKYEDLFADVGTIAPCDLWTPTGEGLLLALRAAWRADEADPLDAQRHAPGILLPVYTRLSDAEENERARMAAAPPRDLRTGVEGETASGRATMHEKALAHDLANAKAAGETDIAFRPLSTAYLAEVVALDAIAMPQNAWSEALFADDLPRRDRSWWMALAPSDAATGYSLVGFAGGMVVDGELQILKVAVDPAHRRQGIAAELMTRVAEDARNLGANRCSLEVRASNAGAQQLYKKLGLKPLGTRPHYYQDREDALIMEGPLPQVAHDVAGMELQHHDDTVRATDAASQQLEQPLILAIESSCDETAAALIDGTGALRADVLASQVDFHARFGGVVPEIASRKHIEAICGVCDECLEVASANAGTPVNWRDLTAIAATYTPGLVGALVVGVAFAKGAAWALDVPFIGVNHLEGHLYANKLGDASFAPPAVVSLVSGGNTLLVHMRDFGDYEVLGSTIDDAVGEAFDKVAKALGLGYPGGPIISGLAKQGNAEAIPFPRAMLHSGDLRFSLSGLKTAVVTYIEKEEREGRPLNLPNIAASFQQAVVDVQVAKAERALEQTGATTFCLGGGVAANPGLRQAYEDMCARRGVKLVMPPLHSCGDNAGMIALVALDRFRTGKTFSLDADAFAHSDLEESY